MYSKSKSNVKQKPQMNPTVKVLHTWISLLRFMLCSFSSLCSHLPTGGVSTSILISFSPKEFLNSSISVVFGGMNTQVFLTTSKSSFSIGGY